ncbi:TraI/MobA(P) family conjugative relaxase [Massilia niabensis]|uniref:TraI/MobA(P) family conjugative relaxase n=1 Tax=Massilia niabensis TaxID=544910 RepID=A0ABW0L5M1_9BURK
MIAKHIAMNAATKSSFSRLVRYLTDSQGKAVRTGAVRITNCMNDSADVAALEILNTQAMNTRSTADKTYHLIISFRAGEHPDLATLSAIEDRLCDGLGFIGHQRISVVHDDTDNLHLHLAINKIHPTRYTIHEPFQAYRILARLCDTLEVEYGLQIDNHTPGKTASENRAADMEHHTGIESLLGWVKRACADRMRSVQSWDEMHALLFENGLRLHPVGNGLAITTADGTTVKASSVGREFSKPGLEQRLGPFKGAPGQQENAKPARRYQKTPLASRVDTTELYARYREAQAATADSRAREWECARARKERRIDAVKRSVSLKRAALKLASMPRAAKKLMYSALARASSEEIAAINATCRRERQAIDQQHPRYQWADWLRHEAAKGDIEALAALRGRKTESGLTGDAVAGNAKVSPSVRPSGCDSVTRKGTIIYHAGGGAIRDDGNRLNVSLGADQAAILTALQMAVERYGERIAVNGSDAFKKQILKAAVASRLRITFVDPALEQRRLQLVHALAAGSNLGGARAGQGRAREDQPMQERSSAPDQSLRGNDTSGRGDGTESASGKYVAEREQKRVNGFDIPKHARYTHFDAGTASYAGIRQVDDQALALLRRGELVMVLEVDDAAAQRLKRVPLGTRVEVNARGAIKAKGRSR